jgi:hypothetical protein
VPENYLASFSKHWKCYSNQMSYIIWPLNKPGMKPLDNLVDSLHSKEYSTWYFRAHSHKCRLSWNPGRRILFAVQAQTNKSDTQVPTLCSSSFSRIANQSGESSCYCLPIWSPACSRRHGLWINNATWLYGTEAPTRCVATMLRLGRFQAWRSLVTSDAIMRTRSPA